MEMYFALLMKNNGLYKMEINAMKGRLGISSEKWIFDSFSLLYWSFLFVCYYVLWIFGMDVLLSLLRLFVHTASYEWNELMTAAFVSIPSVFLIMLFRIVNFKKMQLYRHSHLGICVILFFGFLLNLCMYSCDGNKSDILMIARGLLTAILIDPKIPS